MENRQQWGSRYGFIMAAVGSAVGLGNIWRFPAVAYENGGGAFYFPYLFALLTAGIPILILEFTIGHKYRGSAPLSFFRISKKAEWLGWWQVLISFVICTYYAVIIAWAVKYTIYSVGTQWGAKPDQFLYGKVLKLSETPGDIGSLVPGVVIPLLFVWAVTLFVLYRGVSKGIERLNKIFIPTLVIMFLIIVIRAVTLDGAAEGLNAFFKPNWDKMLDGKVWVAAYGQIFFSLSIGFAIMLTYSSYLPKKSDINNNAFITGFANSGFELLAGIGVFAALGFMAKQQGVPIDQVVSSGIGLAFVVFPSIINEFPGWNGLFGILFFLSLVFAGMTSLISIVETFVAGVQDKFNVSRTKAVLASGLTAAVISLLFATNGGLRLLDIVDYFINNFGVALAGLVEIILMAWFFKGLTGLQKHANEISDLRTGAWWKFCLAILTPLVLGYMMFDNIRQNLAKNYEGYPTSLILFAGVVVAAGVILVALLLSLKGWKANANVEEKEGVA
ncbi:sodium-dependent transporter [Neobacillus vireti]|uniref:Na+-dependent transporter n=1 Tax=Neobacillus vireti LMG 21834 TaxID=1131730 RepID=A0AB94IUU8_9BACI|nr:sodium-dependent transporter [Neobacillus vireti]ETI70748.1 Na+-dependent transporter [Neobacillus vireti LMG 21834]KLT18805.1 transporter [Neobacillus vireti]